MDKTELRSLIFDITDDLRDARLSYQIWWTLQDIDNQESFDKTMNRYRVFFVSTIHAHLVTVVVTLYRLFESRQDTINIPNLIKEVEGNKGISKELRNQLNKSKIQINSTWKKVTLLRMNVFGHRSKKLTPGEAFRKVGLTFDEVRDLIHDMQDLMNHLSVELISESHAFNADAEPDLSRMMKHLKAYKP